MGERFTSEQVSRIIRRALRHEVSGDSVSFEELAEIAQKQGVSEEALRRALAVERRELGMDTAREAVRRKARQEFNTHLRAYLIVNTVLVLVNLFTSSYPWVLWPILGWGLALAFDATDTFFATEEEEDEAARRWLEKRACEEDELGANIELMTKEKTTDTHPM